VARRAAPWLLPCLATFAAWHVTLGQIEPDHYSQTQVAALLVALVGIGVVAGWWAPAEDLLDVVASAVAGISIACWVDWSDDETGLFVIGWLIVTLGAVIGAFLVIERTSSLRHR
jgi:hypothetical protein